MIINILKNKFINGTRFIIVNYLNSIIPFYLVNEYPKSGGTWLGQMLSDYLEVPFPRNEMPFLKKSMFHGHYLPSERLEGIKKIFFLVRDGRDVIVSLYYHTLFINDRNKFNPKSVYYYRKQLKFNDYDAIKDNLPEFIEFMFTHRPSKVIRYQHEGSWKDFNEKWLHYSNKNDNILIVKYEDLLEDTVGEIKRILNRTIDNEILNENKIKKIAEKYNFEKLTGRKRGVEVKNSFLRSGISGDWKNKFNKEAAEIFNYYAGELLIKLNYESDKNWIEKYF